MVLRYHQNKTLAGLQFLEAPSYFNSEKRLNEHQKFIELLSLEQVTRQDFKHRWNYRTVISRQRGSTDNETR